MFFQLTYSIGRKSQSFLILRLAFGILHIILALKLCSTKLKFYINKSRNNWGLVHLKTQLFRTITFTDVLTRIRLCLDNNVIYVQGNGKQYVSLMG